jgi:hypothetical protein
VQGGVGVVGHSRERTMRGGSAAWILLRRDTTPFVHRSQHLLLQPAVAAGPASMPRCIETRAVMKDHGGGGLCSSSLCLVLPCYATIFLFADALLVPSPHAPRVSSVLLTEDRFFVYSCCLAIAVDLLVKQVVPLHGRFFFKNISLTPCNGYSNFVWPVCRAVP